MVTLFWHVGIASTAMPATGFGFSRSQWQATSVHRLETDEGKEQTLKNVSVYHLSASVSLAGAQTCWWALKEFKKVQWAVVMNETSKAYLGCVIGWGNPPHDKSRTFKSYKAGNLLFHYWQSFLRKDPFKAETCLQLSQGTVPTCLLFFNTHNLF